jgi:acetate CoA/acetoacetate CoA-transferase alpha subunit
MVGIQSRSGERRGRSRRRAVGAPVARALRKGPGRFAGAVGAVPNGFRRSADHSLTTLQAGAAKLAFIMKTISLHDAVAMIPDGARLMIGGFMGVGTPERVVDELVRQRKRDLTVIANDNALPGVGIGKLVSAGLVRKTIASHIGLNPETQKKMLAGDMEVELVPQGTLIERIRAAGFGLGGILTPTGVGTVVEEGKQRIEVDGKPFLLETALRADFALVQAFLADYIGNLQYALTARNFNPVIAMAAHTVIVEAENIVRVGVIAPDHVMTPAPIVDYLIASK